MENIVQNVAETVARVSQMLRILHFDDNSSFLNKVHSELHQAGLAHVVGHKVTSLQDIRDGLPLLEQADALITDGSMRDANYRDVLTALSDTEQAAKPVLIFSGDEGLDLEGIRNRFPTVNLLDVVHKESSIADAVEKHKDAMASPF